jgi:formate dehydrogenase major subunit
MWGAISPRERVGREIIAARLEDRTFIEHATEGFDAYKAKVEPYTLEYAERESGVPADAIRDLAHAYATADRAMICWTLGITEHHNAVDNVLAPDQPRPVDRSRRQVRQRHQPAPWPEQRPGVAATWGALPNRLPGFQHVENGELRAKFDATWGVAVPPHRGWTLSEMFDAMERRELTTVYCIGENPLQSEADQHRARELLEGLGFLVVQDLFLTKPLSSLMSSCRRPRRGAEAEGHGHQQRTARPARA